MRYYRVLDDNERYPDRWFLDEPLTATQVEIDARQFTCGQPYGGPLPAVVPIAREGRPVAFNLGAFDMPVVSVEIGSILAQLASSDIQRFPVHIGDDNLIQYEILNAVHQRQCVDEARSGVRKWTTDDGRPDKVGHYIEFQQLVIDPFRTAGSHMFRIWGSLVELIVSERVKEALETIPNLGVVFHPV